MPNPIKIVVATRNEGKFREIAHILSDLPVECLSLKDFPKIPEVEEKGSTYLENAREKARIVAQHCQTWALADDSGLEVEGLGWQPGVRSARFAGKKATDEQRVRKVLEELSGFEKSRRAVFRCVMALVHHDDREYVTEGELWGEIAAKPIGYRGFGYDPIFWLPDQGKTLAELIPEEKNKISHRAQALLKMKVILKGFRE